jgi:hypothetical protein
VLRGFERRRLRCGLSHSRPRSLVNERGAKSAVPGRRERHSGRRYAASRLLGSLHHRGDGVSDRVSDTVSRQYFNNISDLTLDCRHLCPTSAARCSSQTSFRTTTYPPCGGCVWSIARLRVGRSPKLETTAAEKGGQTRQKGGLKPAQPEAAAQSAKHRPM